MKDGHGRGVQRYICRTCDKKFSGERRQKRILIKHIWRDYIFHKQTVEELALSYTMDPRTIRGFLDVYVSPEKIHHPRSVHLVVDATYFGERTEDRSWCVIAARDPEKQEDIAWIFTETETTSGYRDLREKVEALGYTILSVTGDGFEGIKSAFFDIPYQMCHVHMERIVTRGTTQKPKTEQGTALLALVKTLHQGTDSHTFRARLKKYFELCKEFLDEKTFHEESGRWDWTHRELRQAALSLSRHEKYLFSFEHDKNIPKNTNSIEGHFSHIKRYLGDHRGVTRPQAQRILHSLLLASSVSPSKNKLVEIL